MKLLSHLPRRAKRRKAPRRRNPRKRARTSLHCMTYKRRVMTLTYSSRVLIMSQARSIILSGPTRARRLEMVTTRNTGISRTRLLL